ncbi:hypothetical protein [Streptomyces chartreusis]
MLKFHLGRDEPLQRKLVSRLMQAVGLRYDDQAIMTGIEWVTQQVIGGKRELSLTDIRAAVSELGLLAGRTAGPGTALNGEAPALVARPRPVTNWQPDRLGVHRAVQEHDGTNLPPYIAAHCPGPAHSSTRNPRSHPAGTPQAQAAPPG